MRNRPNNRYRLDTSTLIALGALLIIGALTLLPSPARASYRPAPSSIVHAALSPVAPPRHTTAKRAWIVCHVFGRRHCIDALNVAWCESTLRPWAANGQYLGAFQMGSSERARFGHGPTIWQQAPPAHRYFALAGWGPWECRP